MHTFIRRVQLKIIFISVLLNLPTAHAQTTSTGLDLVVIVDQSGSMSGVRSNAKNDPEGVRNDMVRRIYELLAKDGVLNKVTHRLGVVSFGTTARVDLPLSQISAVAVDQLRTRLDASLSDASLGDTHVLAAFDEAKKMLAGGKKSDGRKKVVILITDGAPYIPGIEIGPYKEQLRELIETSFPYPDYQLYITALNDAASNYWERYSDFWQKVSHNQARKLKYDKEEIFRALHELFNNLTGTPAEHIAPSVYDNVVIPPYLESVAFDIFSVDPEAGVQIFPANAPSEALTPKADSVTFVNVGKTIQTITIRHPAPGRWTIRKTNEASRIDVFTQRFFPRGKLMEPNPDAGLRQYETAWVRYRVVDGDGNPIKMIPGYPLTLALSLVKPDSSRIHMEMETVQVLGEGVYQTKEEVTCDLPGRYRTEVLIATRDLNNQQVPVFRDQYSSFEVRAAKLIECKVIRPQPFESVPLYGPLALLSRPLQVEFKFIDDSGQPINLPAIFGESATNVLTLSAVHGNREEAAAVALAEKGGGILAGETNALNSPGEYRLKIRANKSVVPSHYALKISPNEVAFTRSLTVVHWAQVGLMGLALLSLVGSVGYIVWMNQRFPLRGILYIERIGGGLVREFPLTRRRNRLVLKEVPLQTTIKRIIVRAKTDRRGVIVTVINEKNEVLLKNRTLPDKGQASLPNPLPYILRYHT